MQRIAALCFLILFFQSCTYAISPAVVERAEMTIPFEKLQADPDTHKGKIFVLGGTIVRTIDMREGTLVEIIQKRLDYWGKPEHTRRTAGRFLVFSPGRLNAMAYSPGRDITIAGEAQGTESALLDRQHYDLPLLLARELRLWDRERRSWDKPQWIDPLYDPDNPGK